MKKLLKIVFSNMMIIVVFIALQIAYFAYMISHASQLMLYVTQVFTFVSVLLIIVIINERSNSVFKLAWTLLVVVSPVFGSIAYLSMRLTPKKKMMNRRLKSIIKLTKPMLQAPEEVMVKLKKQSPPTANLAKYVERYGGYPIYKGSDVKYFPLGEDKFREMMIWLRKAKHFIFLEYFIIDKGYMWDEVLGVLKEKAKEGVEVRVMYDGMNTLTRLPFNYVKELKKYGIQAKVFSPIHPFVSTYMNYRDHRKILVVDGEVGFTGGINIADEYINKKERFGHWKDVSVMVYGEAVKNFTLLFLQMWHITDYTYDDYEKYIHYNADTLPKVEGNGYILPYGDSPLDLENVGELIYLHVIQQATRYVHIMTPYLVLDNEMITALTFAAKRGVEVIIIMPHIPDKKITFAVGKTYYEEFLESGVKIYEYLPGFVHAKVFLADDLWGVVGTINLDFRSLYLNYECGCYIYRNTVLAEIEEDFQNTLAKSKNITMEEHKKTPLFWRLVGAVMKMFAPLM